MRLTDKQVLVRSARKLLAREDVVCHVMRGRGFSRIILSLLHMTPTGNYKTRGECCSLSTAAFSVLLLVLNHIVDLCSFTMSKGS